MKISNQETIFLATTLAMTNFTCLVIFQGTLKDSLERYSLYGLEDTTADYDCGFKNEIEDQIKLVSTL